MSAIRVHGGMTLRGLTRRHTAVGVLVVMPLALYVTRRDATGQAVRALLFGMTWSASTVALFASVAARDVERRLSLGAVSGRQLAGVRTLTLGLAAVALAATYWLVVALDQDVRSIGLVGVDLALSGLVAVAVGTAIASLIGGELEGTLLLFFLAGLQAVADPAGRLAKLLPFWSSRELGTVAIDGPDAASLGDGLVHAVLVVAVCVGVVVVSGRRQGAWRGPVTAFDQRQLHGGEHRTF